MGTPTAESRRSCPSPAWRRTSNRAGNGSLNCRTTAPSSGFPVEKDEPHRHLREELFERQDVLLGEDYLAQRVVFREPGEDELLEALGGDQPMGAVSSLARDLLDVRLHPPP